MEASKPWPDLCWHAQKIPKVGDGFEHEGHRYTVEEMEGHRIAKVRSRNWKRLCGSGKS